MAPPTKARRYRTSYTADDQYVKDGREVDFSPTEDGSLVLRVYYTGAPKFQNYLSALQEPYSRKLRAGKRGATKLRTELFKKALAKEGYDLVHALDVDGNEIPNTLQARLELLEDAEFLTELADFGGEVRHFQDLDEFEDDGETPADTPTDDSPPSPGGGSSTATTPTT